LATISLPHFPRRCVLPHKLASWPLSGGGSGPQTWPRHQPADEVHSVHLRKERPVLRREGPLRSASGYRRLSAGICLQIPPRNRPSSGLVGGKRSRAVSSGQEATRPEPLPTGRALPA